jgi:DNA-binding MarR family transcriptional regulator
MSETIETSRSPELAARLRLAIARMARRLRQEADAGLSPSLGSALATVERHGPLTPSRLAELERVQRPTATRMIARLEAAELVERTVDPADGRSRLIAVTRLGAQRMRRTRTRKTAYLARRMAKLPPEELETLERAAEILERMLDEKGA